MKIKQASLLAALALPFAPLAAALPQDAEMPETNEVSATEDEMDAAVQQFASELSFTEGTVEIAGGRATVDLPEGWAALGAADARRVVEEFWGNPEDTSVLGFLDPPSEGGRLMSDYGIIVSVDDSGYVEDDDAGDIDYDELLAGMQESTRAANEERSQLGYGTVDLVGWATPPYYDAAEKKLHWAKELRFEGNDETTVNYDVRVLGRRGYLVLQAVAPMSAYDQVDPGMRTILGSTRFNEGHRYSDFDPSIDKVAAVGIAGLIGGKLAAKAGLFAVLAKFGKVIVVAIIGVFVALKRFVFGGKEENPYAHEEEAPTEA